MTIFLELVTAVMPNDTPLVASQDACNSTFNETALRG